MKRKVLSLAALSVLAFAGLVYAQALGYSPVSKIRTQSDGLLVSAPNSAGSYSGDARYSRIKTGNATAVRTIVLDCGDADCELDITGPTASVSGTNTGDQTSVSGNAGTATALQTARTINGTSFDGTANITVAAAAGTLTGSTLASGVTASSLTSFGAQPTLTDFTNATHTHASAAQGGTVNASAIVNDSSLVTATGVAAALDVLQSAAGTWVYSPTAGSSSGNVFTDFNALWAKVSATEGPQRIYVPEAAADIPPKTGGGAYDFEDRIWFEGSPQLWALITFLDGSTITNMGRVGFGARVVSSRSAPVWTISSGAKYVNLGDFAVIGGNAGSAAFFRVTAGALYVSLNGVQSYLAPRAIELSSGASATVSANGPYTDWGANSVYGPVGSTFSRTASATIWSGAWSETYPNFLGTLSAVSANTWTGLGPVTSSSLLSLVSDESGSGPVCGSVNPTLDTPAIANFSSATHSHANAAGGGTLNASAIAAGTVDNARLDGELSAIASLTSAADLCIYYTGSGAAATFACSSANRTAVGLLPNISGNAATVTTADAASDSTTFPMLATSATGSLAPATDSGLLYDASAKTLTLGAGTGSRELRVVSTDNNAAVRITGNNTLRGYLGSINGQFGVHGGSGATADGLRTDGVGNWGFGLTAASTSKVAISKAVATSGVPNMLLVTGAADTAQTASTEKVDVDLNLARTVQRATGATTAQSAVRVRAPPYPAVGATTTTDASSFSISGAPTCSTNMTCTRTSALWVQSGTTQLDGALTVGTSNQLTIDASGNLSTSGTITGTIVGNAPTEASVLAYSECKLFIDGDHVVESGAAISQADDRCTGGSAGANDAVQATAGKKPTLVAAVQNGYAGMSFDGGDCLQTPSIGISTFDVFVVVASVSGSAGLVYEQSPDINSNNGSTLYSSTGSTASAKRSGNSTDRNIGTTWLHGQETALVVHHYGQGTHNDHGVWLRGNTATANTAGTGTASPGTGTVTDVVNIGSRNNAASLGLTGTIVALAIFSPALTPAAREGVSKFFANKYALSTGL